MVQEWFKEREKLNLFARMKLICCKCATTCFRCHCTTYPLNGILKTTVKPQPSDPCSTSLYDHWCTEVWILIGHVLPTKWTSITFYSNCVLGQEAKVWILFGLKIQQEFNFLSSHSGKQTQIISLPKIFL